MKLGGKFWLTLIGGAIAFAVTGIVLFIVLTGAWARWGFLGTFLLAAVVMLIIGWIYDRNEKRVR